MDDNKTADGLCLECNKPVWRWDVFGGGLLMVDTPLIVPLWRRVLTMIFLGSRWKKL